MKDIRERFEKEFGARSDYFNHRLGLFMEMEDWIVRECRKEVIKAIEKCASIVVDKEFILKLKEEYNGEACSGNNSRR